MGTRVQRHVSRTSKVELGKSEKMDTKFILESKEGDAYFKWNQNKRPVWTDNVKKAYKFATYESAERFVTPDWHIVSMGFMPEDLTD